MAIVTLNYKTPVQLPSSTVLQPHTPTHVPDWESDIKSRVVQRWVEAGILLVGNPTTGTLFEEPAPVVATPVVATVATTAAPPVQQGEPPEQETAQETAQDSQQDSLQDNTPTLDELRDRLEDAGVKVDKRWGLQRLLDEVAKLG